MIQLAECLSADEDLLARLRQERPLIHCITNYVTANDVANVILAAGASPVMADNIREVEEITALSNGLVLNLGTLKEEAAGSMLLAGKQAARLGHPIILDPVGAGASQFRTQTAQQLMTELPCTVIRGNASEIRTLAGVGALSRGVDADSQDQVRETEFAEAEEFLAALSRQTGAVIVMSGAVDMVAGAGQVCKIRNGHPMMAGITGTGCMMDGLVAAFQAVRLPKNANDSAAGMELVFWRCVYAVAAAGICGELAYKKTADTNGGTGSFRMYYLDAVSRISDVEIQGGARIEV